MLPISTCIELGKPPVAGTVHSSDPPSEVANKMRDPSLAHCGAIPATSEWTPARSSALSLVDWAAAVEAIAIAAAQINVAMRTVSPMSPAPSPRLCVDRAA